ncbi:PREDICTED: protein takeout [Bactrocera latifrons]|uniref:Protein takeout n=1 Tax=Bactrocera latifrons TaxID=174628 RepID=A0A0K8WDB6_BACLA|nr:PREDICTED: protein takeout [Bactrocera latifrons]
MSARMRNKLHSDFSFKLTLLPSVWLLLFVQLAVQLANTVAAKDLPSTFDKCKRDANFDKCLVDAVNNAILLLKDGNKEFGIPPLEPLAVKSLVIDSGNAPITLKQTMKNLLVHDMISTSKVQRYRTDLNNHLIICDSKTDRIEMVGDYEMSGRILLLPITGNGKANLTLINTRIEHRLIGEPFMRDGVKYMRLKEYRVDLNPKRVYMQFDNLFNDRLLSQTMNRFLNDNWETVFNELKVGYASSFGKIFRDISNKLFEEIPFDSIFLSS